MPDLPYPIREEVVKGASFQDLIAKNVPFPPCVNERATFMADFDFVRRKRHPYVETSPRTHGHFLVRSKSEVIIANPLHARNIDYEHEQQLIIDGVPQDKFPDFRIEDDDAGVKSRKCSMVDRRRRQARLSR